MARVPRMLVTVKNRKDSLVVMLASTTVPIETPTLPANALMP